jgi:two-component system response regulator ResD
MAISDKRILVIDSNHDERTVLASFLKGENYSVYTAEGLNVAIREFSISDFHCLILDVNIPEMKGYEAVSILKTINPEIQIIMTSKHNTKELEARGRAEDIFFYFIKSFGKEELKLAINNVFRRN